MFLEVTYWGRVPPPLSCLYPQDLNVHERHRIQPPKVDSLELARLQAKVSIKSPQNTCFSVKHSSLHVHLPKTGLSESEIPKDPAWPHTTFPTLGDGGYLLTRHGSQRHNPDHHWKDLLLTEVVRRHFSQAGAHNSFNICQFYQSWICATPCWRVLKGSAHILAASMVSCSASASTRKPR